MGDQAMFVRREVLERIGGVPQVPLMEELELGRRLRQHGRLVLADTVVSTSARRFRERGVLRTYARMWRVAAQYRLGTPAEELQRIYEEK
jgi:GT2 family glycosyltransferase